MPILLVDDDSAFLSLLGFLLERHGYPVITAPHGHAAGDLACQAEIALIDMVMPEMDGLETIEHLRWRNPDLKFMAMSGTEESVFRADLDRLGVQTFLSKPFSLETLLRELGTLPACAVAA